MTAAARAYLKRCGWTVVTERPLVMCHEDGSTVRGQGARIVVEYLNGFAGKDERIGP